MPIAASGQLRCAPSCQPAEGGSHEQAGPHRRRSRRTRSSSKSAAAAVVESFIEGITKALKKGDSITFVGFGTFKTSQRKARTARNPQTGAAIKIPKRRVVRFTAGKALKNAVR